MSKKSKKSANKKLIDKQINFSSNVNLEEKFQIAYSHQKAQRFSEAEKIYREIIQENPSYIKALGELGNILQNLKRFKESAECYRKIIKISPDNYLSYTNLGLALIKQGLTTEAIDILRQSLKINPDYFQSNYLLAGALIEVKKYSEATEALRQTIKLNPNHIEAYYNLGCALQEQEKYGEAIDVFRQLIKLNPSHYAALNSLGFNLEKQGLIEEAQVAFEDAIKVKPDFATSYNNLGLILAKRKLLAESKRAFTQAIKYAPNYGEAYNNLALIEKDLKELNSAIANFKKAIELEPTYVLGYSNLGNLYQELGRNEEAEGILKQAIKVDPNYPTAYNNLANLYQQVDNFSEAEKFARKAIELQPNDAQAHTNLGVVLYKQGFLDEAEKILRKSQELDANNCDAHLNLSLLLLLKGEFEEGFNEYKWRFKTKQITLPEFTKPQWQGEDLHNKTILLIAEQGLGDTLQFIRYAAKLKQMGATVKLCCQESLISLCLKIEEFSQVILLKKKIDCDYDYYLPIMSMPQLLGETPNTVTTNIPYITQWQKSDLTIETPADTKYKIGIVWASNIKNPSLYKQKSCAVEFFTELLKIEGITFYSLQVGIDADSINQYLDAGKIIDLSPSLQDFSDTAEAISQLELIITIDTAVAHLAGAMGKKVWNLLPYVPDWRWFLDRNDSPWYPTMRLFRQPKLNDWVSVFVELGNALVDFIGETKITFTAADFEKAEVENKKLISTTDIFSLANKLVKEGNYKQAESSFNKLIQLQPNNGEAYNNLAYCLQQQNLTKKAKEAYEKAIELQPTLAEAHSNLAALLTLERDFKKAEKYSQQAINLKPDYEEAYTNLACIYHEQGLYSQEKETYQKVIEINQDNAEAKFSLSLLSLLEGNYREGFRQYECRFAAQKANLPKLKQPQWQEEDITNKTILVICEQGFGDNIQFVRFVYLLSQKTSNLKIVCYPKLVQIFSQIENVNEVLTFADLDNINYDFYIPIMSLPHLLGITLKNLSQKTPYLNPSQDEKIDIPSVNNTKFKIGIVWKSKSGKRQDFYRKKSCAVEFFIKLLKIEEIALYSLQVGKDAHEIEKYQQEERLIDLSENIDNFNDTASIISQLDLVISIDTAVTHLAGAMGKQVWTLLPYVPDWRWLLAREDSPWYPTMRLFRQPQLDDWVSVFVEVGNALSKLVADEKVVFTEEDFLGIAGSLMVSQIDLKELENAFSLGIKYHRENNFTDAEKSYRQVIDKDYIQPPEEIIQLIVKTANNLSVILTEQKRHTEAIKVLEKALKFENNSPSLYYNLGRPLTELKELDKAEECFRKSLDLNSQSAEANVYLGLVLKRKGLLEDAEKFYKKAIKINPNLLETYINLGIALVEQKKVEESSNIYYQLLEKEPNNADAHANLACNLMLLGDFKNGFSEYEWRLQTDQVNIPKIDNPRWQGENLQGKRILLVPEQGLGDMIQFVRYADILREMGATIKIACGESLVTLFETIDSIQQVLPPKTVLKSSEFDYYIPIMSIPHVLGTNINNIHANIPYIKNIPTASISVPSNTKLKVGFAWATNIKKQSMYHKKSCPIDFFIDLLDIEGITLYSLQVGVDEKDIQPHLNNPRVVDLRSQINSFFDTASLMKQLDLIISVDTAVVHLAGAIAKPVWTLLPFMPDWRWFLDREDSPWYPTMRLFRQPKINDWQSVFAEVKNSLVNFDSKAYQLDSLQYSSSKLTPDKAYVVNLGEESVSEIPIEAINNQEIIKKRAQKTIKTQTPTTSISSVKKSLGIACVLNPQIGWGNFATNTVLQMLQNSNIEPILLLPFHLHDLHNPLHMELLTPLLIRQQEIQQLINQNQNRQIKFEFPVLLPLANNFASSINNVKGSHNVGKIVFENSAIDENSIEKAKDYDAILVVSNWNKKTLNNYGLNNVFVAPEGIDPAKFHPAPKSNLFGNRFVIFSAGKLEYRKGQDLVVAAFKKFLTRHPQALLITAWQNMWPNFIRYIDKKGHVEGLPNINQNNQLLIKEWLVNNGIPPENCLDVGLVASHILPQVIREADVALFPNRCEGGTNMIAMECMACGIPTILSANTGHLDLLGESHCYILKNQGKVEPISFYPNVDNWGECDIDEIVETLEEVYQNRDSAIRKGKIASLFMEEWTWEKQTQKFCDIFQNELK